jgi:hypothetical protein
MLLRQNKSITDLTLEILKEGSVSTTGLISAINKQRPKTTKQGIYRALRDLGRKEIITIHNSEVSLNSEWLNKIQEFLDLARFHYQRLDPRAGHFLNLKEGEKIRYTFRNLQLTDTFWNHAIYLLLKVTGPQNHFFAFNPHCWFLLARHEQELALIKQLKKSGRLYLVTVANRTFADKSVAQYFDNAQSQYYMAAKPLFNKTEYYLNVIGDFIIEVWINKELNDKINRWYDSAQSISEEKINELNNIVHRKGTTRLAISRHGRKAQRLKKMLEKNFYIPRKY